jgi:hypothetical protein
MLGGPGIGFINGRGDHTTRPGGMSDMAHGIRGGYGYGAGRERPQGQRGRGDDYFRPMHLVSPELGGARVVSRSTYDRVKVDWSCRLGALRRRFGGIASEGLELRALGRIASSLAPACRGGYRLG